MFEFPPCIDESAFRVTRAGLSSYFVVPCCLLGSGVLPSKGAGVLEGDLGW
jgi:hypothetical protein